MEVRMCPIDRPRSTTPIIPSSLEDYCDEISAALSAAESAARHVEKLKISLPQDAGDKGVKPKSPRKSSGGNWFDFAEMGIQRHQTNSDVETTPPPLPPKGVQKDWINFEEIPEKRKPPKRIQTIPSRYVIFRNRMCYNALNGCLFGYHFIN